MTYDVKQHQMCVVLKVWIFYYRMSFLALGADQLQSQVIMRWWICVVLLAAN